jgi:acetylglutamate kinase
MKNVALLLKLGGSVSENNDCLRAIVRALCEARAEGATIVLVHGGGREINRNLKLLNEKPEFVEGLRITNENNLNMVEMTLSGSINKKLAGLVNREGRPYGILAAGISGVDGMTLVCRPLSNKLGRVGRIVRVDAGLLETLLAGGYLPVVSPISIGEDYLHYNVNADDAASALASALKAGRFIFLSDVAGVQDADGKILSRLTPEGVERLIRQNVVTGGMIPKLRACCNVLDAGVREVHVCGWEGPESFKRQITGLGNSGTVLRL